MNTIFRTEHQKDGKLGYAQKQLEIATLQYENNLPIYEVRFRATVDIPVTDYLDAKDIYKTLMKMDDYKIRVDPWRSLTIYSNDKESLVDLRKKLRVSVCEFWEPETEIANLLLEAENIIIVDTPVEFPYKITLGRPKKGTSYELGNWLKNNTDKSKVGKKALQEFLRNGWTDGLYFYIRDERVLMLVQMMIGNKIRRIDKLVYIGNIDK